MPSWLELVTEVEDLFGPMPDFEVNVRRGIECGTALVMVDSGKVQGAALLSRNDRPKRIHWLAVRRSAQGQGVGTALLVAILDHWPTEHIEVVTFASDTSGGQAARGLYEKFGFRCLGGTNPAPDGGKRDLYVLRR